MTGAVRIVHLDDSLAVVDKPAGLVVHQAPSHRGPTLVDELREILGGGGFGLDLSPMIGIIVLYILRGLVVALIAG